MITNSQPTASDQLLSFLRAHKCLLVLTGAGISVGSGIPTYRNAAGTWLRTQPITHQEFVADPARRQRYWGRSLVGWPGVRDARPGPAHRALTQLEHLGRLELLVTQNVDRLHQRAGSARVIDLHGRLDQVRCLDCGALDSRENIQQRLQRANPHLAGLAGTVRPDGDADLTDEQVTGVSVPSCGGCGGVLMPDVVFFGGSVPAVNVQRSMDALARADALLVIGSSLQVYSGFRFCRRAAEQDKPIALLNPGDSRADALASLHLRASADVLLPAAVEQLGPVAEAGPGVAEAPPNLVASSSP